MSILRKRHNGKINLRQFERDTTNQRARYEARLEIASDIIKNVKNDESSLLALAKIETTTKMVDAVASGLQSDLRDLTGTVNHIKTVNHRLDKEGLIALYMESKGHRLLQAFQSLNDALQELYGQTKDKEKELLRLNVVHLQQKLERLEDDHKSAEELLSGARKDGILDVHHVVQTLITQRDEQERNKSKEN